MSMSRVLALMGGLPSCMLSWRRGGVRSDFQRDGSLEWRVRTACPGRDCSAANFWQFQLLADTKYLYSNVLKQPYGTHIAPDRSVL